jgi:predicted RNA polymerase sigma factor
VRLARLLNELMPGEPEVLSLLALLLFTAARRPARTDAGTRSRWPARTGRCGIRRR